MKIKEAIELARKDGYTIFKHSSRSFKHWYLLGHLELHPPSGDDWIYDSKKGKITSSNSLTSYLLLKFRAMAESDFSDDITKRKG